MHFKLVHFAIIEQHTRVVLLLCRVDVGGWDKLLCSLALPAGEDREARAGEEELEGWGVLVAEGVGVVVGRERGGELRGG